MTIADWIKDREIRGYVTFSIEDVYSAFPSSSAAVVMTSLQRQMKAGRIQAVHKGFYVVIPPHYMLKGIVPPYYYIHNLMQYLRKPYYVALLSAAELHGAAHQRVQRTQVMTTLPKSSASRKNMMISWSYRREILQELLCRIKTETNYMYYSSAELTAVDLVQYADYAGGYQFVATVLAELVESIDMSKMTGVVPYVSIAALQRLGYLLEFVLEEKEKADELYTILRCEAQPFNKVRMRPNKEEDKMCPTNRWRVNMNIEIELDEI